MGKERRVQGVPEQARVASHVGEGVVPEQSSACRGLVLQRKAHETSDQPKVHLAEAQNRGALQMVFLLICVPTSLTHVSMGVPFDLPSKQPYTIRG